MGVTTMGTGGWVGGWDEPALDRGRGSRGERRGEGGERMGREGNTEEGKRRERGEKREEVEGTPEHKPQNTSNTNSNSMILSLYPVFTVGDGEVQYKSWLAPVSRQLEFPCSYPMSKVEFQALEKKMQCGTRVVSRILHEL